MRLRQGGEIGACFLLGMAFAVPVAADPIALSGVFGDHMVLQRDVAVPVWGTGEPGVRVTVTFAGQTREVVTDDKGRWSVRLEPLPASAAPGRLEVCGPNGAESACNDVVVGDVWLCSGQSNMAWAMGNLRRASAFAEDLATADFPLIRQGTVPRPRQPAEEPLDHVKVTWAACTPASVDGFTAAGFYMARELHRDLGVPIGILFAAVGGSAAEQWISRGSLDTVPAFAERAERHAVERREHALRLAEFPERLAAWEQAHGRSEPPNRGEAAGWMNPGNEPAAWQAAAGPARWSQLGMPDGGVAWVRTEIVVPAEHAGQRKRIDLGGINAQDVTLYWNGRRIGSWGRKPPEFNVGYARFDVPAEQMQAGSALLAIRFVSPFGDRRPSLGHGSFKGWPGTTGDYQVRVEERFSPLDAAAVRSYPAVPTCGGSTLLFNAMIHPLAPYAIRGFVWYQGESDGSRGYEYRTMLPLLITDWRSHWHDPERPVLVQQLPNWSANGPADVNWAELREAQWLTAERVPNVFLSVGIDLGESDDVHPVNKRDIGRRLALVALARVYGKDVVCSGPRVAAVERTPEGAFRVTFHHHGPLTTLDGAAPRHFQVAGADRTFVMAEATIDGDAVTVRSPDVAEPEAVRYAWFNDPALPNLSDSSGLPAVPFRGDSWPIRGER
jgi:sialate O-acetylesterase